MNRDPNAKSDSLPLPYGNVFWHAAWSMVLLWLAFPPIGWAPLAWVALIPLIHVTVSERPLERRNYWQLGFAGLLYWLATFYFIPIPHPALWLGWIVISVYLACYLPLFVFCSRSLHTQFRIPNLIAVPISWTGLELIRCHLFTGMGLVCLAHTQFRFPTWIQISDLFGAYSLTFVMALVATGTFRLFRFWEGKPRTAIANALVAIAVLASTYFYGNYRLTETGVPANKTLKVGLIQGSIDTVFPTTLEQLQEFRYSIIQQYETLTIDALNNWDSVDLILWPENGWQYPDLHPATNTTMMPEQDVYLFHESPQIAWSRLMASGKATPPMLVGASTVDPVNDIQYGAAILLDDNGQVQNRYFKNHLVMFGEYVPLADVFPLLRRIPAIGKGLNAGSESITIDIKGVRICPSICFETTVPHYIRRQVNSLAAEQNEPDVLANLTNDGWFYGTSCLDFHLACNVFRAVEMRKPMLVCANTGLSAHIDHLGQIQQEGPRRDTANLLAEVSTTEMRSLYRIANDWVAIAFAALAIMAALMGVFKRRSN